MRLTSIWGDTVVQNGVSYGVTSGNGRESTVQMQTDWHRAQKSEIGHLPPVVGQHRNSLSPAKATIGTLYLRSPNGARVFEQSDMAAVSAQAVKP